MDELKNMHGINLFHVPGRISQHMFLYADVFYFGDLITSRYDDLGSRLLLTK